MPSLIGIDFVGEVDPNSGVIVALSSSRSKQGLNYFTW